MTCRLRVAKSRAQPRATCSLSYSVSQLSFAPFSPQTQSSYSCTLALHLGLCAPIYSSTPNACLHLTLRYSSSKQCLTFPLYPAHAPVKAYPTHPIPHFSPTLPSPLHPLCPIAIPASTPVSTPTSIPLPALSLYPSQHSSLYPSQHSSQYPSQCILSSPIFSTSHTPTTTPPTQPKISLPVRGLIYAIPRGCIGIKSGVF